MRAIVIAGLAAVTMCATYGAAASEQLAKSNGCLNCHAMDTKKVGPSIKDMAAKLKGKPDAQQAAVTKLTEGKGHPKSKASPADAKEIVAWMANQ
jgi:cytochrome c